VRGQLRARPRATVVPDPQLSMRPMRPSQVKGSRTVCTAVWQHWQHIILSAPLDEPTCGIDRNSRRVCCSSAEPRRVQRAAWASTRLGTSAVGHTVTVGEMRACLSADKRCSPQEHSPAHRGSSQSSSLRTDSTGNASRLPIYTRACVLRVRVHACVRARVRVRVCVCAGVCGREPVCARACAAIARA
jgi:hypothetical protein